MVVEADARVGQPLDEAGNFVQVCTPSQKVRRCFVEAQLDELQLHHVAQGGQRGGVWEDVIGTSTARGGC